MPAFHDVRMKGFRDRADVDAVLALLRERIHPLPAETVPLADAAGRVLAQDVTSEIDVPQFDRSAMDGYAVRGADTFGAAEYNPIALTVIGRSMPGRPFTGSVGAGQAVQIMTGAPVPAGADAVVTAEGARCETGMRNSELGTRNAEPGTPDPTGLPGELVQIVEPVPPGKNIGKVGEDIVAGTVVLRAGRRLRPQDLGVLSSIGRGEASVHRRPRVALLVTGDELLAPGGKPTGAKIADANSPMLTALVRRDGGVVLSDGITSDDRDEIRRKLSRTDCDVLLVVGGSSVGMEDHAPSLVAELGELPVHGVAMRPSSPAGVGFIGARCVFLLPGNPVSCLCAYDFFAGPAIRRTGGGSMDWPHRQVSLPLSRKIASAVGRVDYVRVRIENGAVEPIAVSGASILSSTTRADGFVIVPRDSEGRAAGETVTVWLYD